MKRGRYGGSRQSETYASLPGATLGIPCAAAGIILDDSRVVQVVGDETLAVLVDACKRSSQRLPKRAEMYMGVGLCTRSTRIVPTRERMYGIPLQASNSPRGLKTGNMDMSVSVVSLAGGQDKREFRGHEPLCCIEPHAERANTSKNPRLAHPLDTRIKQWAYISRPQDGATFHKGSFGRLCFLCGGKSTHGVAFCQDCSFRRPKLGLFSWRDSSQILCRSE